MSWLEFFLGSLGCARSAQQNIGGSVASARSAHMKLESSSEENVLGGHTRKIHKLKRSHRVTEHFEGETVQRKAQKKTKLLRIL
jgi:hypothetical protein